MNQRPIYEELEQKVRELEKEALNRKQVEETLKQNENMYRTIFESTGTATIMSDEDMTVLMVNSEFEKLSGYSKKEIEGKMKWTEFVAEDDLEKLKEYHHSRRIDPNAAPRNHEFKVIDRHGNVKDIFATVAIITGSKKGVASFLDITDYKEAQKERLKRQKLEGVLEMAGAVCHEMNQPMQTILGNCELLMMDIDENSSHYKKIHNIMVQIERMRDLTDKLMNIKEYKTMNYIDGKIIDIHKASK
ncbi:MAG: PAS domain S-box protein [Deltaproteobacteria bacterium]|nr:PAS domain S-box protein [Deltaproteobacteria bacterium]